MGKISKAAVIGSGAAGLMAAYTFAVNGIDADLYEKNQKLGLKLGITGKGRCNLTNNCDIQQFLSNVVTNPRFLYSALSSLSPEDMMRIVEDGGVPLKTERGNRVFPQSDRALDIVSFFLKSLNGTSVSIIKEEVKDITVSGENLSVKTSKATREYGFVIIATGGLSYPQTGSTGDGYRFSKNFGHTVTPLRGALVPLESPDPDCRDMQGLSLKNVKLTVTDPSGKKLCSDMGEMLFTHFGISGPLVLSASSVIKNAAGCAAHIDLKPALDNDALDARILRDFSAELNKDFKNSLGALLPQKMIPVIVRRAGIDPHKSVNLITREERRKLVGTIKDFTVEISSLRPVEEAIVTGGGVSVKEINPKTMESKLVPGVYFAGEIIDVDALTGGFNLQIAFSTAYLAAKSICEEIYSL